MSDRIEPPYDSWGVVPFKDGVELHCPICGTPIYFDGRSIALDDLIVATGAHRCPVGPNDG